jgi:hypothetical protein
MKCGYCNIEGHNIRTCSTDADCIVIVNKAYDCLNLYVSIDQMSIAEMAYEFYEILMSMEYTYLKMSLARLNRNKYTYSLYDSTNRQITTLSKHVIACHLVEDYFILYVLFKQFQEIDVNELQNHCNEWRAMRVRQEFIYSYPQKHSFSCR